MDVSSQELYEAYTAVYNEVDKVRDDPRVNHWLRTTVGAMRALHARIDIVKSEREIAKHEGEIKRHRQIILVNSDTYHGLAQTITPE